MFQEITSNITAPSNLTCPIGYSAYYCSLYYSQATSSDLLRWSSPLNSQTCTCKSTVGAGCFAWCSTYPAPTMVIKSGTNTIYSACPTGSHVIGCHLRHTSPTIERWMMYLPTDNFTCECYDRFGGDCFATCASNVKDYEVVTLFGYNYITVNCSNPTNKVLGCGYHVTYHNQGTYESFGFSRVNSERSCQCYAYFGADCTAFCGKLYWHSRSQWSNAEYSWSATCIGFFIAIKSNLSIKVRYTLCTSKEPMPPILLLWLDYK